MEALSPTMEEGRLVEWKKQRGRRRRRRATCSPRSRPTRRSWSWWRARRARCSSRTVAAGSDGAGRHGAGAASAQPGEAVGDGRAAGRTGRTGATGAAGDGRRRPRRQPPAPAPAATAAPPGAAPRRPGTHRPAARRWPGQGVAARADASRPSGGSTSARSPAAGPEGRVVQRDLESARRRYRPAAGPPVRARPSGSVRAVRRGVHRRSAHPDPQDDRQAAGPVDRPDPHVLPHDRGRHGARGRGARGAQGALGDEGKVSFNDIVHQGDRRSALRAASRVQRLVAGRPHPLLARRCTSAWRWRSRRAHHAGHPARRPRSRCARSRAEARDLAAARAGAEAQARGVHRRHVLGLQPRHVRHRRVHRDHQSARGRDPGGRAASRRSRWCTNGAGGGPPADAAHDVAAITG